MKRSILKRTRGIQRRVSARRAAELAEYRVERQKRWVRARGRCEVCQQVLGDDWQSHHVVRRSHTVIHRADNLIVVHPECHARIHREVAWAKSEGYILTQWHQLQANSQTPLLEIPGVDE